VDVIDYQKILSLGWDRVAKVLVVLLGSFAVLRLVRKLADQLVKLTEDDDPTTHTEREQRARTLAGIFKGVARITIVILAAITIMATMGISVAPLIAGAGVAGLAISFGAQNLIRDVIAGFFILMENQFRVGDVIRAAGVSGLVEDMNLRVTVLRDTDGAAHFIPNGEIKVVSNLAKTWARAVVDVGVAYRDDLDRVLQVLKEVGAELNQDARFGPLILEPPQVLGVEKLGDSEVTVRILTKTRALKQWEVARELRKRIKTAFDRERLEFPFPQRVIRDYKAPKADKDNA